MNINEAPRSTLPEVKGWWWVQQKLLRRDTRSHTRSPLSHSLSVSHGSGAAAPASRHALTHALTAVALALASLTPRAARIPARPPFKTCNTSRTCTLLTHLPSRVSLDSGTLLSHHTRPARSPCHPLSLVPAWDVLTRMGLGAFRGRHCSTGCGHPLKQSLPLSSSAPPVGVR